jgi:1-phosphofructokinase
MITTVTLNPCLDLTLSLESLKPGALNMVRQKRLDIAGKGLNVSVVLRALGLSTMCLGINFEKDGGLLENFLEERCIAHDFAVSPGGVRTNIKLLDAAKAEMTEINSYGDPVEPRVVESYLKKLEHHAHHSTALTFSGRVPNGGDYADIYRRSLELIKPLGVLTIVDAEKEPLKQAILAKPYLIKPNLYELETAFGCKTHSKADIAQACRDVIDLGVEVVCCSMGGDGAMIVDKDAAFFAPPVAVEVKGLQGAGDSLVAGLCKGLSEKLGLEGMLRCGVAAASASLTREGTLLCRAQDYDEILKRVIIEEVKP